MRRQNLMMVWLGATLVLGCGMEAKSTLAQPTSDEPRSLVRGLIAALGDQDPLVVTKALDFLRERDLQDTPEEERSSLKARVSRLLEDKNQDAAVRTAAGRVLGAMGEATQKDASLLADLLSNTEVDVRRAAVEALGAMGEAATDKAPRLVNLLAAPEEDVRNAAAAALEHRIV